MENVRAKLALFSIEKAPALHLTSFLFSLLLQTIATSQSAYGKEAILRLRRSFVAAYAPHGRQRLRPDNADSNEDNCQLRPRSVFLIFKTAIGTAILNVAPETGNNVG